MSRTFVNSEDHDEMLHSAVSHYGMVYTVCQKILIIQTSNMEEPIQGWIQDFWKGDPYI